MHIKNSVLFICTANQIRSPIAEELFKEAIGKGNKHIHNWQIDSAGTWAKQGLHAIPEAVNAMQETGRNIQAHRSRRVSREMLNRYQLILTMETGHKEALQIEFPDLAKRIFTLGEMSDTYLSIPDPIGKGIEEYRITIEEINFWIQKGFARIVNLSKVLEKNQID
ncbi:MAG: hypothetical protein JEZ06_15190 [Anaerolineaceae bacterium]|nr:hypothetical protein [Anaerolineaceae bacterium]